MAKDKYVNFPDIYYKIPREFIEEGLKAEKDTKLYTRVKQEMKKAIRAQEQLAHLITVLERIEIRVGQ